MPWLTTQQPPRSRYASTGPGSSLTLEVRLESVFLSVRPIVLSLARSTMFSCTTAVSSNVSVHRLRPFGGAEQASAIKLGLGGTVEDALSGGVVGMLVGQGSIKAFLHQLLARVRATVSMLVSSASAISPSLQASPASEASAFSRMRALQHLPCGTCGLLHQRVEAYPLVSAERYDVSLCGRLFCNHDASPGCRRYRFRDWPQNQRRRALEHFQAWWNQNGSSETGLICDSWVSG